MEKKWWHDKVAYQIYPKSFCDANGDGIGDLRGILSKLDYLKALGVDIIWLSPVYKSPFVDQGYDISDYYAIAQEFGTMEDMDLLLAETKKRGMYLLMDLVINHCSSQHPWFQKALQEPEGEYAQRFYFVKGKDGEAPSNYRSYFGGSAWEPVPGTDKYYLHMFAPEQPDLNWESSVVRQKIFDMVNWWLDKGLAGFRIDAIINIKKTKTFPDYPADGADGLASCVKIVEAAQGVGKLLEELKRETFQKHDAFTVGEVFNMKEEELAEFVGENGHFSTMFDFAGQNLTSGGHGWYDAPTIQFNDWRRVIADSQKKMEGVGFLANFLENHDEPRCPSRFLPDYARNEAGKKMLGTVSMLLRGIPFVYQGQEIGMENCRRTDISQYDDISTKDQYRLALEAGCTKEEALEACFRESRDNARTPMQWTDEEGAGFTIGTPWLALNPNYKEINVREQEDREDSLLHYYRRLISLRKDPAYRETFTYGTFEPAYHEVDGILAYTRTGEKKIMVAANFGKEAKTLHLTETVEKVLLSNVEGNILEESEAGRITLESCQCAVLLLA